MGNEMGNNNVSGLKEEENKAAEAPKHSSQEGKHVEDVKWKNLEVPAREDEDFREKAEGLHPNDPSRLNLKEEENRAAEGQENSSWEGNHVDDVEGKNQEVPASEDKNFHANAEGLHSNDPPILDLKEQNGFEPKSALQSTEVATEPDNKAGQESGSQVMSLAEELNHLEKATEPKNEENMLATREDQMEKKASFGREAEEEASSSIHGIESASTTMESSAPNSSLQEESLSSCQAEEKGLVETEGTEDLAKSVLLSRKDGEKMISKTLREETASQERVVATTITHDDQSGTATKDDVANNSSSVTLSFPGHLDNKCKEKVPTEIHLSTNDYYVSNSERTAEEAFKCNELVTEVDISGNGSSHDNREITTEEVNKSSKEVPIPGMNLRGNDSLKPPKEAISLINSPNTFEQVPEPLDRFTVIKEDPEVIGSSMLENKDNKHHPGLVEHHEQVVNETKIGKGNAPQPEMMQAGSAGDNEKKNTVDSSSNSSFQDNQSKDGKVTDQLEINSIKLDEGSKESEELTEISPAIETVPTGITAAGCQSKEAPKEKAIEEVEEKAENSKAPESSAEAISSPAIETVSAELTVTECQNEEDPTEKKAIGEAEERAENSEESESGIEAKETPENPIPQRLQINYPNGFVLESPAKATGTNSNNERSPESEGRLSSESIPVHPSLDSELRKSPSFDFDLSLNTKYEESDQTPLLIHDKAEKRSHSKSLDVSDIENKISQGKYGPHVSQYQPISVEEKTIKVERSDSDKSRARIVGKPQKDEKQEMKDCEPSKEVATTKGSGKRKARPSLFTTCICCAAAIN